MPFLAVFIVWVFRVFARRIAYTVVLVGILCSLGLLSWRY